MMRVIILADAPLEHLHWARALQRGGGGGGSSPFAGPPSLSRAPARPAAQKLAGLLPSRCGVGRDGMGRTGDSEAFLSPTAAACANRLGSGQCVKASSMKSNEASSQDRRRKHWPLRAPARSDQSHSPSYVGGSDCHMQD